MGFAVFSWMPLHLPLLLKSSHRHQSFLIPFSGFCTCMSPVSTSSMTNKGSSIKEKGLHVCNSPICTLSQNGYGVSDLQSLADQKFFPVIEFAKSNPLCGDPPPFFRSESQCPQTIAREQLTFRIYTMNAHCFEGGARRGPWKVLCQSWRK